MDERKMILEMLKEGNITTEEAIRLLDAIDGKKEDKKQAPREPLFQFDAEKAKEGWTEIEKSVGGFVSNFINTVFDEDLVFSLKGKYDSFIRTEKFPLPESEDKSVFVTNKNGRIEVLPTEGEEVVVESKIYHRGIEVNDKTEFFKVTEEENTLRYEIVLTPEMEKKSYVDLKLFIPKQKFTEINLVTSNSGINVDGIHAENMHFETKNSKVSVKNVTGDTLTMKNANARFELAQSNVKEIELKTSNGKVTLEELTGEHLSVHTSNGRVATRDLDFADMSLNTTNGTVLVEDLKTERMKEGIFTCSNGKIDVQLEELQKEVALDLHTTNGSIDLDLPLPLLYESNPSVNARSVKAHTDNFTKEEGIELFARTSNGSIVIHS